MSQPTAGRGRLCGERGGGAGGHVVKTPPTLARGLPRARSTPERQGAQRDFCWLNHDTCGGRKASLRKLHQVWGPLSAPNHSGLREVAHGLSIQGQLSARRGASSGTPASLGSRAAVSPRRGGDQTRLGRRGFVRC